MAANDPGPEGAVIGGCGCACGCVILSVSVLLATLGFVAWLLR
jgi:hypothetical protein